MAMMTMRATAETAKHLRLQLPLRGARSVVTLAVAVAVDGDEEAAAVAAEDPDPQEDAAAHEAHPVHRERAAGRAVALVVRDRDF